MSKHLFTIFFVILIAGFVSAASAQTQTPPEGVPVFHAPKVPAPGTKFIFSSKGKRWTQTVSDNTEPFNGRATYRTVQKRIDEPIRVWDAETHNLIARLDRGGKVVRFYKPHESEFEWPLWPGKTYRTNFVQVVKRATGGRRTGTFDKRGRIKVEAFETIKVPAGTFETMRLKVKISGWSELTIWRAEDIPIFVKLRSKRRTIVLSKIIEP